MQTLPDESHGVISCASLSSHDRNRRELGKAAAPNRNRPGLRLTGGNHISSCQSMSSAEIGFFDFRIFHKFFGVSLQNKIATLQNISSL